ncbi:complement C1q protein 3-like [Tropilaelaps mercedesae]|uniref:Complement C1q protein 3-like n=1 Tax=Tropilaelaps mercedesae TaxID=418985 RepID=A0A1V9XY94_9ACAR|nr:complement C1q protein 3-like [Tropilaelaps mercedesae]
MWFSGTLSLATLGFLSAVALGQQVGFMMARGKLRGNYIGFELLSTSVQAELDQEVGAFRCSKPGLFYFSFTAIPPRESALRVSLRKNRIPVTTLFASSGGHTSVTGSMLLCGFRVDTNADELNPSFRTVPAVTDGEFSPADEKDKITTMFHGNRVTNHSSPVKTTTCKPRMKSKTMSQRNNQ